MAPETDSDVVSLEIESLAVGGRGVGRSEGVVWFVDGAVPGDRVEARAVHLRPRFVEGRLVRIVRPSTDRRIAACPVQDRCGGCPWMTLDEEVQRDWKRRLVQNALGRIARIPDVPVDAVRSASAALGYRNKVEFAVGLDAAGRPAVGLYSRKLDHGLIDVEHCFLQADEANRLLGSLREFLLDPRRDLAGRLRPDDSFRMAIRQSDANGSLLVVLQETARPFPLVEELGEFVRTRHPNLLGLVRVRGLHGRRGGGRSVPVFGQSWIEERIGSAGFRLPAATFTQVNGKAGAELLRLVSTSAGQPSPSRVVDLYGGVGAYSFAMLARGSESAVVCDADRDAIECGRRAASRIRERRIRFVHSDVRRFLREARAEGRSTDLVISNPPRSGLGRGVVEAAAACNPRRWIMISCDPATLARDLGRLASVGFRTARVIPVDLFPQTAHVEVVALAERD